MEEQKHLPSAELWPTTASWLQPTERMMKRKNPEACVLIFDLSEKQDAKGGLDSELLQTAVAEV